jgi:hypothetical protein
LPIHHRQSRLTQGLDTAKERTFTRIVKLAGWRRKQLSGDKENLSGWIENEWIANGSGWNGSGWSETGWIANC